MSYNWRIWGCEAEQLQLLYPSAKVAREFLEKDANMKDMCIPVDFTKTSDIQPEAPFPGEEVEPPPRDLPRGGRRI